MPELEQVTAEEIGKVFRDLCREHVSIVEARSTKEVLWTKVLEKTGEAPSQLRLQALPNQLELYQMRKQARAKRAAWVMAALTGLSAVGFAFLAPDMWSSPSAQEPQELSFAVSGGQSRPVPAQQGQLIASEREPVQVELSDSSTIELQPHTTVRLSRSEAGKESAADDRELEGAETASQTGPQVEEEPVVVARVAQGRINVQVEESRSKRYRFHAGPYIVRVIGTAFSLEYEPRNDRLHLEDVRGMVEVSSPQGQHRVKAGQSLKLSSANVPAEDAGAQAPAETSAPADTTSTSLLTAPRNQKPAKTHDEIVDFSTLAAKGEFQKIVSIAKSRGISQVLSTHSSTQLQELAQAARYTGQLGLAEQTWRTMSQRFAGRTSGNNAKFFLGRLAEQRGQASTALRLFDEYLRTSPSGIYSAEAWGRKLQVIQSTQGAAAAKQVAAQYLERFPRGAYAKSARAILAQD